MDAPAEAAPARLRPEPRDLPDCADENATGTLLVIYTDETAPGGGSPLPGPRRRAQQRTHPRGDAPERRLDRHQQPLAELPLHRTGCCTDQPLEAIRDSNGNAALIYTGSTVTGITEPAPFTGDPDTAEAITSRNPAGLARRPQRRPDSGTGP
jgi:hypothetical protein